MSFNWLSTFIFNYCYGWVYVTILLILPVLSHQFFCSFVSLLSLFFFKNFFLIKFYFIFSFGFLFKPACVIDCEDYSISSKGFLPTVVDIMVIGLNSPILVRLNSPIPKMSMFTLAVFCLTAPDLPWFTDVTFQVPTQYCSLKRQTWLWPPVTSTTGCRFLFDSASSFLLELLLHSSSVAYWAPTDLESSSFSIMSFCLFILIMGFSRQEYWSGLPLPSPVGPCFVRTLHHDLSILGGLTWHGSLIVSLSFIELWSMWSVWLVFWDCGFHSICRLMDKRLVQASWWEGLAVGESGSCLWWARPCLIKFSSVAQSCLTLCDPMDSSMPGFPVYHQLMELTQTHVYWVGDAIQPSHPLSSPSPPAFYLSQHQGLFQWVSSSHQVAKVLEFQLQHQSFQWIFWIDFL